MFWALNGVTRHPRRAYNRHSPVTNRLFPADDMLPSTINDFAVMPVYPISKILSNGQNNANRKINLIGKQREILISKV
jgi:hypothetical protein